MRGQFSDGLSSDTAITDQYWMTLRLFQNPADSYQMLDYVTDKKKTQKQNTLITY